MNAEQVANAVTEGIDDALRNHPLARQMIRSADLRLIRAVRKFFATASDAEKSRLLACWQNEPTRAEE